MISVHPSSDITWKVLMEYTRSMSSCIRFMGSILTLKMWTHQKYCNPRKADIVERYRPLKRIRSSLRAVRVVLIPVDAWIVSRIVVWKWLCSLIAHKGSIAIWRKVSTQVHAAVFRRRANVVQLFRKLVVKRNAVCNEKYLKNFVHNTVHGHLLYGSMFQQNYYDIFIIKFVPTVKIQLY